MRFHSHNSVHLSGVALGDALRKLVCLFAVVTALACSRSAGADGHWAFTPPVYHNPPAGPAASPIDRFLLAALKAKGLGFSPPADRRTLIRRVTFDLVGLPPTPGEIEAFVADRSPD